MDVHGRTVGQHVCMEQPSTLTQCRAGACRKGLGYARDLVALHLAQVLADVDAAS